MIVVTPEKRAVTLNIPLVLAINLNIHFLTLPACLLRWRGLLPPFEVIHLDNSESIPSICRIPLHENSSKFIT